MMNTLANHGYIPHDGRRITEEVMVSSLGSALNISPELAIALFRGTLPANPQPNATFFSLYDHPYHPLDYVVSISLTTSTKHRRDLNRHNLFEHDASLRFVSYTWRESRKSIRRCTLTHLDSRNDDYFGDNHTFNQTIFDESRAYWTGPVIDARMIANSKIARQIQSKAFNPTYYFPERIEALALGEMAAPFVTLGDKENVLMDRAMFEYLFGMWHFNMNMGRLASMTDLDRSGIGILICFLRRRQFMSVFPLNLDGSAQLKSSRYPMLSAWWVLSRQPRVCSHMTMLI